MASSGVHARSGADPSTRVALRARERRGTVAAPTLTPLTHGHKHTRPTQGRSTRATEMPTPAQSPIFNEFAQWTEEYLSEADGVARQALEARGEGLAKERRQALAELIEAGPEQAIALAVPLTVRQQLPASIVGQLEERVSVRAKYEVIAVFGNSPDLRSAPTIKRRVTVNDRIYRASVYGRRLQQTTQDAMPLYGVAVGDVLAVHEGPVRVLEPGESKDPSMPADGSGRFCPVSRQASASGVRVEAGGEIFHICKTGHVAAFGQMLEQQADTIGQAVGSVASFAWTLGPKTVLIMRVNFPDAPSASISEADAYDLMRTANNFFVENSFGATSLSAMVTPLLTLPYPAAWYGADGADTALLVDARRAAVAAGYDPDGYDLDCVHFRLNQMGNQAYVGAKGIWLQTAVPGLFCHELGHNFGLWHANAWVTSDGTVIGSGHNQEYGNVFDAMGSGEMTPHPFNACHKNRLGWLPETSVQSVTSDGVYRVFPCDSPMLSDGLTYALKIRMDSQRDYWIETRRLLNTQLGPNLLIHWSPWGLSHGGSQLLDMTPNSAGGRYDAPLALGKSFYDPNLGLKITPLRLGGTSPESIDILVTHPPRVSARLETNGQVKITVAGVAGVSYLVEATSDFVTWETVGAVTSMTETSQITDTDASQHESRFYRAMAK